MLRIGVRFNPMRVGAQARLDRLVFRFLRAEARTKRHTSGELAALIPGGGDERRDARRVSVDDGDVRVTLRLRHTGERVATTVDLMRVAASKLFGPSQETIAAVLRDLSASGCSLVFPDEGAPRLVVGTRLWVILRAAESERLELGGTVMRAVRVPDADS